MVNGYSRNLLTPYFQKSKDGYLPLPVVLLSGGIAGIATAFLLSPIDLVKTRLQVMIDHNLIHILCRFKMWEDLLNNIIMDP